MEVFPKALPCKTNFYGIHKHANKNRLTEDSPVGKHVYFTVVLREFSLNNTEKKASTKNKA